jgi:hypothetical protein
MLPEDNESAPRNARSKLSDVPSPAPPSVKAPMRFKIILEEDAAIPPIGLFISANGKPYLLMAGVEAQVPLEVISVLNDAVTSVPVVDPQTQRVTGYRPRLRFPYRRIDG